MNPPHPSPDDFFCRLLDESAALLSAPTDAAIAFPDDDLHREILIPLLPALLGDAAIRKHWQEQAATGFAARLLRHLQDGEGTPRWQAGDFEIQVTASYSAGPDAKALADTLLSEDSLRDMSAALMNQVLDVVWTKLDLPLAAVETIAEPIAEVAADPVVLEAGVIAVTDVTTAIGLPPLPAGHDTGSAEVEAAEVRWPPLSAAWQRQRPRWKVFRGSRENPIAGTKTWRGKLGEPDWSHTYPLAGGKTAR